MYRMVKVNPPETKFQNILWRTSPSDNLETYRLNTITYGTASASFLATRCLQYIADSHKDTFPEASKVISNHFYMDDLLFCASSIEHVLRIKAEVTNILATAGFILRKFLSNKSEVLDTQTDSDTVNFSTVPIGERTDSKTLGLHWDSIRDLLFCKVELPVSPILTKRGILSSVAKIYDPLGLYAPLVIRGKLLIQSLWQSKLDWDDPVPTKISTMWFELEREFRHLDSVKVPRCIIPSTYVQIQLHGFADASSAAYGACIYVRCVTSDGRIFSNLLTSKSRVAPLRTITIPRLELCAAVILSELTQKILKILSVQFHDIFLWTDSQIVLNWINSCPSRYKIFVANRIAVIQELTEIKSWRYVKSSDNPADIVSRGTHLADLATINAKWFTGPSFLQIRDSEWNLPEFSVNADELSESKNPSISINIATHTVDPEFTDLLFSRYSTFGKLQRVFAYILRFVKNLKSRNKVTGNLTVPELKAATVHLVRLCQQCSFSKEINCLKLNKNIKDSSIQALNPFIDDDNCVRVGGRIKNSNFAFDKKFPLLLPKNNKFTDLIISKYHKELLHCGAEQLLYSIRENYWPINGRYSVKRIIRRCITCFKVKPSMLHPCMSNLPDARLQVVHPFYNTGLDYAGPILVKDRRTRGAKLHKAYICVFVCLTTRAVHLELLTSATSDAFISTLKRFIARRGKPHCLHSDNATTFRGAKNKIDSLYNLLHKVSDDFVSYVDSESIDWRFINPRSPHEGGMWERSVQSVKYHLKRVLGNASLVFEDMYTVLVMIEAVLNSRPLSYLSSDPNDLTPITPGHFLIGRQLLSIAEPRYIKLPENRLSAYQRLQYITEHFWKRWCKEVVPEFQRRTKWFKNLPDLLKVDSIVLLYEDGLPPLQWVMGRVTAVNRSSDGVIRTAALQLPSGNIVKRSVHRLCVLPTNENDS